MDNNSNKIEYKIIELAPNYAISEKGVVININSGEIKKITLNKKGYQQVSLNSTTYLIHRLVALAFLYNKNPTLYTDVNHKDENKLNNHYTNLEWLTKKENNNYGQRTNKSTAHRKKKVKCIDIDYIFNSIKDAAYYTDTSIGSLYRCLNGEIEDAPTKNGVRLRWKYVGNQARNQRRKSGRINYSPQKNLAI